MRGSRKRKKAKENKHKGKVNETANVEASNPNTHRASRELVTTQLKDKINDVANFLRRVSKSWSGGWTKLWMMNWRNFFY